MDLYPRYPRFDVYEGETRIAARLSDKATRHGSYRLIHGLDVRERPSPRFRIKVATWPTSSPIILADAARPAFRGQYPTLDAACLAMDNIVRRERNMPSRPGGIREAVKRYLDAKSEGAVIAQMPIYDDAETSPTLAPPIVPPAADGRHHVGQHVQGCRACYAYTEGRVSGSER